MLSGPYITLVHLLVFTSQRVCNKEASLGQVFGSLRSDAVFPDMLRGTPAKLFDLNLKSSN